MRESETRKRATSDDVSLRRQARAAITDIVQLLDPLRNRVVVIAAQARHGHADREKLNRECERIAGDIGQMRAELLLRLMDTPPSVAGHSRVVDVEKAIDSLERQLADARQALQRQ